LARPLHPLPPAPPYQTSCSVVVYPRPPKLIYFYRSTNLQGPSVTWLSSSNVATAQPSGNSSDASPNGATTALIAGLTIGAVLLLGFIAGFFYLLGKRQHHAAVSAPENFNRGELQGTEYPKPSVDGVPFVDVEATPSTPTVSVPTTPTRVEKGSRGRATWTSTADSGRRLTTNTSESGRRFTNSTSESGRRFTNSTSESGRRLTTISGMDSSEFEDDTSSSTTWITGPPAYDQLAPSRQSPRAPLSNIPEESLHVFNRSSVVSSR